MKFVFAIVAALIAAGFAQIDLWQLRRHRNGRLVYPKFYLVLAVLCTTFFAALEILSLAIDPAGTSMIAHFWFVAFALVGLIVILGSLFEHYELTEAGIRFKRLIRPAKSIGWAEVSSFEFSSRYDHFDIRTSQGVSITVPSTIVGSDEFAVTVLKNVSPRAIDENTLEVLEAVAGGSSL